MTKSETRRAKLFVAWGVIVPMLIILALYLAKGVHEREQALAQQREEMLYQLQLMVDSDNRATFMCDENGTIIRTNMAAEQMFGWSHKQLEGNSSDILIPDAYLDPHNAGMAEAAKEIRKIDIGHRLTKRGLAIEARHANGSLVPAEAEITVLRFMDQGKDKVQFIVRMNRMRPAPPVELRKLPDRELSLSRY